MTAFPTLRSFVSYQTESDCYDADELSEVAEVARKLQVCGFIKAQFGRPVPIILHELKYPWYCMGATAKANPNGEADTFFAAMKQLGVME